MREAPASAVRIAKRPRGAAGEEPQRRSKRLAVEPSHPIDHATDLNDPKDRDVQEEGAAISPPGRDVQTAGAALSPLGATIDDQMKNKRFRMKAAALIYALKDVRGYKVSLQSVAGMFKLENRQSFNYYRDEDSIQQILQDKPFVALCIELYEKLQGTDDGDDKAGAKGHIHSGSTHAEGKKKGKKAGGYGALDHDDYIRLIRKARALYKKGSVSMREVQHATGLSLGTIKKQVAPDAVTPQRRGRDRAAILMLFRSKLAMFREASTPALGQSALSTVQATQ